MIKLFDPRVKTSLSMIQNLFHLWTT